jgi:hypothetical protein
MMRLLYLFLFAFLLHPLFLKGSEHGSTLNSKVTISGYVKDNATGDVLAGVTVIETNLRIGASSNNSGFYSITIPSGNYEIQFSYIGYQTVKFSGNTQKNLILDVSLDPSDKTLGEVNVEGKRTNENVRAPAMSIVELDIKTIRSIPSLFGEIDLVKVIQLLPGVQATSEGSTGYSVRGGTADQNLILLDEATIYNASHLMGFFSVFNNDVVENVTLYKGDIPASYGGRLSSLLDVQTKDGNSKKFSLTGSIGTISSKLTLEGPVIKEKTTYLLAGRRTYADLFLPFAKDESIRDNKLFFYDLNLKLTHLINEKNRIYLSGYAGRDVFRNQYSSVEFGNQTASLRWNHLFSKKIFLNTSLIYSRYNYDLGGPEEEVNSFKWLSELSEYTSRFDFTHFVSGNHKLKYGATLTWHQIFPGSVKGIGNTSDNTGFILPSAKAIESSLYFTDDFRLSERLTLKYGFRFAAFQNVGPGTVYHYDSDHSPVDSTVYRKREIYNTYSGVEPRLAFTFMVNQLSSVKGSYSHTTQYLTLAQNSTTGTPLDIWFPASPNVEPQLCDQFAAGYFRNFNNNMYEVSIEAYYKNLRRLIDFRDHAQLFLNQYLEGELRIGKGYSYGLETIIRKNDGRLSGWVSYTYSRSFRLVPEINSGRWYVSPYDKPHNFNIVVNYGITSRIIASATWVYATGLPVTFPTGKATIGNAIIPIYSDRNSYRMEDYHRLDLSISLKSRVKPGKIWQSELNLSVYNVYNRHNTWAINFVQDPANPYVTYAEKTYLFAVIPALTYTFRF